MHTWKPYFLRHGRQSITAVKDKLPRYWMLTVRGCCALLLLLATGGWIAPVAVGAAPGDGDATFDILWLTTSPCAEPPAGAVTALDYAASLWGTWISSTVPISVTACWTTLSGSILGTGMPSRYIYNFPGAPLVGASYPIALANAFSSSDLDPTRVDMTLQFKKSADWSFITTTTQLTAPAAGVDFVTVALHELAHGLGFSGQMVHEYNIGFCGSLSSLFCPTPYDWFVVDTSDVALLSYLPDSPDVLGGLLKSDANFGGPNTRAANGGMAAKLYTPNIWQLGISLSHLDEAFNTGENRLMTPIYSGVTRHPGAVTMAMLQDMGWLRADGVPNVVTAGPRIVGVGSATPFTGTLLWPGYTGQPITYTWTTVERDPLVHPGRAVSDTATLTWNTPGEKAVTLTATDGAASASAVRTLHAFAASVTGPATGDTNRAYTFNASVTLDNYPVTYTWEATNQTSVVRTGQSASNSIAFTWSMSGTKTITVTAVIEGAPTQAVHTIAITGIVFDKFIFLPLVQRQF